MGKAARHALQRGRDRRIVQRFDTNHRNPSEAAHVCRGCDAGPGEGEATEVRGTGKRSESISGMASGAAGARGGDGIHRSVLEAGMAAIGGAVPVTFWRRRTPTVPARGGRMTSGT